MAQPIIKRLTVPCTIIIKMNGKKIVKETFAGASELLYNLRGSLETKATQKIAREVYR